ncbi:hypothetical protein [Motiliproteus coralliicola]|nr:hypothetical protein [Motiliproteus coralliicola]
MMKNIFSCVLISLLLISHSNAGELSSTRLDIKCDMSEMDGLEKAKYFKSLQEKSKHFALQTCKNMLANPYESIINDTKYLLKGTDSLVGADGKQFSYSASLFEEWIKAFDPDIFGGMRNIAYDFANYVPPNRDIVGGFKGLTVRTNDDCANGEVPTCSLSLEYRSNAAVNDYRFFTGTALSNQQSAACKRMGFSNCIEALHDLRKAIDPYRYFVVAAHTKSVINSLSILNKKWDEFSDNSRHQTFVDKWLTTEIYHDQFNGRDWATPPKYQYFLLHPGIVVDHFSAASSGEQTELGLSVEWVGINKWDGKIPLGISITSIYSDRSSGKQVGHGVMLHVDNDYSFGIVDRGDGDTSVFVNLNFFKWFGEKQDKYGAFKEKLGKFRGN